ncbi:2OG-Fe(II) oxygenase family protein [Amycolatopsis sp. cmx-4-61]|uniref:2OG-Fe(II) oxygenase family protein n=1 Tax=Amycolatopsis sp. cmx-4-61 TaxID=2790937 RepID=UPI00397A5E55
MRLISEAWSALKINDEPYVWLETAPGELIAEADARSLAEEFPAGSFVRKTTDGRKSDKSYRNYSRALAGPGAPDIGDLPVVWREFVSELLAPAYREAVCARLDLPAPGQLEVRLVRHVTGDWLGPHTDRADKLFSHVFYFNEGWRQEWGGCLQILRSEDPADVVHTVVPVLGASALMIRADNSWHQVGEVHTRAGEPARHRTSLLVHGLR